MYTTKIAGFLTHRTTVVRFLLLTAFFTILLVVFVQPVGILRHTSRLSNINELIQLSLAALVGLLVLVASRVLLASIGAQRLTSAGCAIWLSAELIVCVATLSLATWLVSGGGRLALAPLAGDYTLGVIAVELLPYLISALLYLLHESQAEIERLRALLPPEPPDERPAPEHKLNFYEKGGRLAFATLRSNVLFIEAANNYTNIHYLNDGKEDTFILHNSLKELELSHSSNGLVRCHRGYMVNLDNVKLIRKESGGLILELIGSAKAIPVTKTYAAPFVARMQQATS